MVYCELISPHRSVGGVQVTLTAPRVGSGVNEIMSGAPTAAGKWHTFSTTLESIQVTVTAPRVGSGAPLSGHVEW